MARPKKSMEEIEGETIIQTSTSDLETKDLSNLK
jgi:hypothetical protein